MSMSGCWGGPTNGQLHSQIQGLSTVFHLELSELFALSFDSEETEVFGDGYPVDVPFVSRVFSNAFVFIISHFVLLNLIVL